MEFDLQPLLRGNNDFASNLCRQLFAKEKTTLLSPISIHSVLTLLSQDPWFFNKDVFNRSLHVDVNKARESYKHILSLISSADGRHVLLGNNVFLKDQFELEELFRTRLLTDFLYGLNSLNFNEIDTAVQSINNWAEENTCNKAKNLIDPGNLSDNTRLTLLNTMYFSDKWAKPFTETTPGTFHINDNDTIQVEMMKTHSEFYYKDMFNCKVLQLPFINNDVSLIVILPTRGFQFGTFGSFHLHDISSLIDNMVLEEVDVLLPKFKLEEAVELKSYISEMGLESIFSANLNGMVNGEGINLDKIKQKVFFDLNQNGSEAASGMVCSLNKAEEAKVVPKNGLVIYEMDINTNISNRFAKTTVIWKTKNIEKSAKEATFKVVLSETAFITGFIMEIEGKSYKSYIKEKEEAKMIYNQAVASGQSAGLVEAKTRDSKEFTVSVNLVPESVAVFNLTYEEMLQRVHDQYEMVLNICPGQIVDNLNVKVDIMETRPLKFVKTPPLRSGNEIGGTEYEKYLDPSSDIQMINAKTASVKFSPDPKKQTLMAHYLETDSSNGLSGQFVVQYDVERDPQDGQVLLQDGYFVHFFAPNDLDPLPKHVVFVLDTSGSMGGRKIIQLKDAMLSILNEIRKNDIISIVEFNSDVILWDINTQLSTVVAPFQDEEDFQDPFNKLKKMSLPDPTYASEDTLIKAKNVVQKMQAFGSTFMIGGLDTALYLINVAQNKAENKNEKHQPVIVFLTDGEPNVGISSTEKIVDIVTRLNLKYNKVPIFSLSFGRGADKLFLRKLSLKNQGFSRHIYEAGDASLQLQQFYKQISSPLLANIQFKYDSEVEELTRTYFPIYFGGSELVVSGRYKEPSFPTTVNCWGPRGPIIITSIIETPVTSLERLWAYLMVKQLLDEREIVDDKTELTKKATSLALKYSFVTDVTSLVVVKPDDTRTLEDNSSNRNEGSVSTGYGAPAATASLFGSVSSSFGAPVAAKSLFGSSNVGYSAPAPSASLFGSSNVGYSASAHSASLFGSSSVGSSAPILPAFGSSAAFGASTPTSFSFGSAVTSNVLPPGLSQASGFTFSRDLSSPAMGNPPQDYTFMAESSLVGNQPLEDPSSLEKKKPKEFLADHPFLIILQLKKENKTIVLFSGCVYKPTH